MKKNVVSLKTHGLRSVLTFFWTGFNWACAWSTKFKRHLFAFSYRRVLLGRFILNATFTNWPFSTFLSGGITLRFRFTFFFDLVNTVSYIFVNVMFMISKI